MPKVVMVRTIVENWVYNLILRSTLNSPGAVSRLSHCTLMNSNIHDNTGVYWMIIGPNGKPFSVNTHGYGNPNITGLPDEIHSVLGSALRGGSNTSDEAYLIGNFNNALTQNLNNIPAQNLVTNFFNLGQVSAIGLDPRIQTLAEAEKAFADLLRDSNRSVYGTYTDAQMLNLHLTCIAFDMTIAGFVPQHYNYLRLNQNGRPVLPTQAPTYNYY